MNSIIYPVKVKDGNGKMKKYIPEVKLRKRHWEEFYKGQKFTHNGEKFELSQRGYKVD